MKKLLTIFVVVILTTSLWAQSPEKMSYQSVIRNSSDELVTNQDIGMQISILQGSVSGVVVYVETHISTSNINGLLTLEIGTGTTNDDFSLIDWSNGPYFIKTEADPTGGTAYSITGTTQFLSVPYALHSKTADSITGGVIITETDPIYTTSEAANITSDDITNLSNLSGVNTGDQDLNSLATKSELGDSIAQLRSEIPDVSGFLTTETDPIYTSSQATNITATDITNLSNLSGVNTGDQDLSSLATKTELGDSITQVRSEIPDVSGFLTTETDPIYTSSQAANITATDITNLNNLSGVNSGDQDLSSLATKSELGDSITQVRSEIPDVSGFLTTETDPIYTSSQAINITTTDITNLSNLSGVNSGDQDLSSLATKSELGDSITQVRSEIPDVSGFLTTETDPSIPTGTNTGEMLYWNGTAWEIITNTAIEGSVLRMSSGVPSWADATQHAIGEAFQGGIIFYILNPSNTGYDPIIQHGLIAATSDQSTEAEWGCEGTEIFAYREGIGTGNQNTIDIEAGCTTSGTAADICSNLSLGGYDDWFLPSKNELEALYINRNFVGGFGFEWEHYWSSSEHNSFTAHDLFWYWGASNPRAKSSTFNVRCVRSF